jgi:hypothetical protein
MTLDQIMWQIHHFVVCFVDLDQESQRSFFATTAYQLTFILLFFLSILEF